MRIRKIIENFVLNFILLFILCNSFIFVLFFFTNYLQVFYVTGQTASFPINPRSEVFYLREINENDILGEIKIEYPTKMTPSSSNRVSTLIYIPPKLVSASPEDFHIIKTPVDNSLTINDFSYSYYTTVVSETMRIELVGQNFEIENLFSISQSIDIHSSNNSTTWAWSIAAPNVLGKQVVNLKIFLGEEEEPIWIANIAIDIVEFVPKQTFVESLGQLLLFENQSSISVIVVIITVMGSVIIFFSWKPGQREKLKDTKSSAIAELANDERKLSQQRSMASIRKQLKIEFDDVQLNSFCLDCFPEVYDKFAEGMQRDRKINLLFKHCRGQPNGLQKLLRLLEEWKKK